MRKRRMRFYSIMVIILLLASLCAHRLNAAPSATKSKRPPVAPKKPVKPKRTSNTLAELHAAEEAEDNAEDEGSAEDTEFKLYKPGKRQPKIAEKKKAVLWEEEEPDADEASGGTRISAGVKDKDGGNKAYDEGGGEEEGDDGGGEEEDEDGDEESAMLVNGLRLC